ncbi:MAG: T9SS type A sorting domain-containing protein [Candidatus Delongbacteria bacterium]
MKKILLGTLAVVSLASISSANLQLNFPSTKLGVGPENVVGNVSADAMLTVDGTDVARVPANVIFEGGSPLAVSLVWAYDSDPAYNLEFLIGEEGSFVAIRDVKVYLTSSCDPPQVLTYSRGVSNQYAYNLGTPFPGTLPTSMPVFATLEPCGPACEPGFTFAPAGYDFGTVITNVPQTTTFEICNTAVGDCPPIGGTVTENCAVFSVEPLNYVLAPGECQIFTVTFTGVRGGPTVCDIITDHGVFTCTVDDQVAGTETPAVFALGEAYPNPFNPTTTLSYSVPENQEAVLSVYNTNGQLVKTLVNGMVERGEHKVVFDASDLASGVYVYTLKTASQSAMHKMVLVK